MAEGRKPSQEVERNRRYLTRLLEDCRRSEVPSTRELVRLIEKALADLPPPDNGQKPPAK
jgi:hypothetical protein